MNSKSEEENTSAIKTLMQQLDQLCAKQIRLLDYEEAEKSGKLMILPCAIGDRIWSIKSGTLEEYTVVGISKGETLGQNSIPPNTIMIHCKNSKYFLCISSAEFGNTLFHEREKAEEALRNQASSVRGKNGANPQFNVDDGSEIYQHFLSRVVELIEQWEDYFAGADL